ncbi:uncharacterized protein LOC120351371 isoform X1 [Nilaparvata lugens]|uniref:uncharacterized protein LOC120351371 isoform X1 n=1 Tax=Nilaparvata lugens TaxID=108931 RepID=UPI00193D1FAC|nr:uncharacterized protein LOC120351371 isoform X1 [Nilaparvata lugens]
MSISLYNRLPLLARDLPAVRFRGALRSLLTDHPLYSLREFCMLESSVELSPIYAKFDFKFPIIRLEIQFKQNICSSGKESA